tara:strand:- start:119 stop:730 length:612 start_codon:yes stop_codon:yes gene_type:complete
MQTVQDIAKSIVVREGGFVNDPDDPGGATKFGVTIHTLRRLGMDLNKDGKVDLRDVKKVTQEQAIDVFIKYYFDGPSISGLPQALQPSVFDMYVNAGSNAVKILQRLLGQMGFQVVVDGVLGPQSFAAAVAAYEKAPTQMVDAYGIARRNYYFNLADRRPPSRKYARTNSGKKGGWIRRAEEFITPKYHLSQGEFQKRVAAWG